MDDGQVIADGPARDVFHKPELFAKTWIIPSPSVGLGTILGIPALTVDELASALTREAE
jgi:hypothetical protein